MTEVRERRFLTISAYARHALIEAGFKREQVNAHSRPLTWKLKFRALFRFLNPWKAHEFDKLNQVLHEHAETYIANVREKR